MTDYSYDAKIGKQIYNYRLNCGLTQKELATQLCLNGCYITRNTIAKIESGHRHIYLYEFKSIAKILKMPIRSVLDC